MHHMETIQHPPLLKDGYFSLLGAVGALEYAKARIQDLYGDYGVYKYVPFQGSYDEVVVGRLQEIVEYFKTEFEEKLAMPFPEPAAPCSVEEAAQ